MIDPRAQPCDEGTIRAVLCTGGIAAATKTWVLVATILGSSMAFINGSVINIALPAIRTDLSTSVAFIQWVINAYTLCLAALILIGGAAGDHFGRRKLFMAGVVLFALASIACGLAGDIIQLVAARAVQGIGAAMLIPNSLAIIGATFEESKRGRAIGTWAGFAALGAAAGPLIGGWLVDNTSWRAIFAISPVIALPTLFISFRRVPESRDPNAGAGLDVGGALLLFLGLGSVIFSLIALPDLGWRSTLVLTPLVLGVVLLIAFMWTEDRSASPMMPLTLFRSRAFSGVNALTLVLYAALYGAFFLLPFNLIYVHGYSAALSGAIFLPFTLIVGILSRWFGGLQDRIGARLPLIIGPTITGIGYAMLASQPFGRDLSSSFLIPMTVTGLGMAVSVAPLTTVVLASVSRERAGVASGINNAVAQTANLMAVAIFGAVALASYNHMLERSAASLDGPPAVITAIKNARGDFAATPAATIADAQSRRTAESAIKNSLADGINMALALAALLALLGALVSALTIAPLERKDGKP
jgi:EmrB/QacA subfamily drug resistance transporter